MLAEDRIGDTGDERVRALQGGEEVEVDAGGHALLTTPAAGKAYRTAGAPVLQAQRLTVREGAALEWLPQETILFCGAIVEMESSIELAGDAVFIGCPRLELRTALVS